MVNAIVQIEQLKNNLIALNVTSIDLILLIAINLQDLENLKGKKGMSQTNNKSVYST